MWLLPRPDSGADVGARATDSESGNSAIVHLAIKNGNVVVVQVLPMTPVFLRGTRISRRYDIRDDWVETGTLTWCASYWSVPALRDMGSELSRVRKTQLT